jgi:hypothetical protein
VLLQAQILAVQIKMKKRWRTLRKSWRRPEYLPGRALLAKILVRLKQCARAAGYCGLRQIRLRWTHNRCSSWERL